MTLGGCADFCVGGKLDAFPAPGLRHEPSPALVWIEDAMAAGEVDSWSGYLGGQPGDEIYRFEGNLDRAIPVRSFQRLDHLSR